MTSLASPEVEQIVERPGAPLRNKRRGVGGFLRDYSGPIIVVVGVLALWEFLARVIFAGRFVLPAPESVVWNIWKDRVVYQNSVPTTVHEAVIGFVEGNVAAILSALLFILVPVTEKIGMRFALVTNCLPVVAIAPLLQILLTGEAPKIALAAVSVYFTTLVIVLTGLRSADPVSLELIRVYGGGALKCLRKVRIPAALPHLIRALQLAVPTALLGAILGEFLGGTQGIGIAMIVAQAELHVTLMWGLIVVSSVIAGVGYALFGLVGHLLSRWTRGTDATGAAASMGTLPPSAVYTAGMSLTARLRRRTANLLAVVASIVFILVVWQGGIKLAGLSSYVAKGPLDVYDYLFSGSGAAANRSQIFSALWTTLRDTGFGLIAGCVVGCALAFVVVLLPRIEAYVLSWGLTLRVLPLAAVAPLIGAIFGTGVIAAIIVCAMISFFPTFVLMVGGLNSASAGSVALIHAYGGSKWKVMRKVRIPASLAAFFASLKIAAPAALLGALVTEWTVTGQGLGAAIIVESNESGFAFIWAAVSIVAVTASIIYWLAGVGERIAANHGY